MLDVDHVGVGDADALALPMPEEYVELVAARALAAVAHDERHRVRAERARLQARDAERQLLREALERRLVGAAARRRLDDVLHAARARAFAEQLRESPLPRLAGRPD